MSRNAFAQIVRDEIRREEQAEIARDERARHAYPRTPPVNIFTFPDTEAAVRSSCHGGCVQGRMCDCAPDVPEMGHERRPGWAVRLWMWIQRRYG